MYILSKSIIPSSTIFMWIQRWILWYLICVLKVNLIMFLYDNMRNVCDVTFILYVCREFAVHKFTNKFKTKTFHKTLDFIIVNFGIGAH